MYRKGGRRGAELELLRLGELASEALDRGVQSFVPASAERSRWSGETYLGTADSLEQAELLNTHIELRRAEFLDRQREERADFNSALDPELAGDDRRFDHDAAFDGLRAIARMHLRPPG